MFRAWVFSRPWVWQLFTAVPIFWQRIQNQCGFIGKTNKSLTLSLGTWQNLDTGPQMRWPCCSRINPVCLEPQAVGKTPVVYVPQHADGEGNVWCAPLHHGGPPGGTGPAEPRWVLGWVSPIGTGSQGQKQQCLRELTLTRQPPQGACAWHPVTWKLTVVSAQPSGNVWQWVRTSFLLLLHALAFHDKRNS